jgi:hypothetical protein
MKYETADKRGRELPHDCQPRHLIGPFLVLTNAWKYKYTQFGSRF